jgi:hypothetical protein
MLKISSALFAGALLAVASAGPAAAAPASQGLPGLLQAADELGGQVILVQRDGRRGAGRATVRSRTTVRTNRAAGNRTVVRRKVVVRRWSRRPYYGTIIGGVALGTVIGAAAVGVVPVAPAPNLCWYWADPAMIRGYWDYCQ